MNGALWKRLGLVTAVVATEAALLWPGATTKFQPERLGAFVLAVLAWLGFEFWEQRKSLSVHDEWLLKELDKDLDPDHMLWIAKFDFGGTFDRDLIKPVFRFCERWNGNSSLRASNKKLLKLEERLISDARIFSRSLAVNTCPTMQSGGSYSHVVPNSNEDGILTEKQLKLERDRAEELNEKATAFCNSYDSLICFGNSHRREARDTKTHGGHP